MLQSLEDLTTIESARQRIRSQLYDNKYDRLYLETGAFWNTADGQRIKRKSRADQRLLRAMDQARRHLLAMNISNDVAYALIGRSVFIRYLEDRDVLTSQWVFNWTDGQTDNFRSVLNELSIARVFFRRLSQHFDNNLFPPSEEELLDVTQDHLDLIGRFLDGHDLDSGQLHLPFWPYDFEFIPIELISGIYDAFLYSDKKKKRKKLGAYYTPLSLVDFIVEETLPIETTRPDMTILDPACGSGVFLVRAYQRLVEAWKRQYRSIPNVTQLSDILKHSIFGIDIEPAAVRIAAFSLYLAMLDYLDKEEIRKENFHFPNLEGTNLFRQYVKCCVKLPSLVELEM